MLRLVFFLAVLSVVLSVGLARAQATNTLPAVITWDNADTVDQVQIDKAPASSGPFTKLITVPAGTLTYTDATNAPGQTSCYRVENVNTSGNGPSSNVACKSFPPIPTVAPALHPIQ